MRGKKRERASHRRVSGGQKLLDLPLLSQAPSLQQLLSTQKSQCLTFLMSLREKAFTDNKLTMTSQL